MKYCIVNKKWVSETKRVTCEKFTDNFDEALDIFAHAYSSGEYDSIYIRGDEIWVVYISYDSSSSDVWMSEPTADYLNQVIEHARVYKDLLEI